MVNFNLSLKERKNSPRGKFQSVFLKVLLFYSVNFV